MLGMALWAGARLGVEPVGWLIDQVNNILTSPRALYRSSAQDIGMLVSGATALAQNDSGRWRSMADYADVAPA